MDSINRENIEELIASKARPAVTIYIPMHTTASPPHISENQIRFKNLIREAIEQLKPHDQEQALAETLARRHDELQNDLGFWEAQSPGLLICANSDFIRLFRLPVDTEEYVAVDEQFHLAPVLALMQDAKDFYVLLLAQHDPVLYKGDLYGLQPTGINLPANIEVGLNIDENNQKTENQGSANGPSTSTGWFNGRGGARNPQEEDRLRFFRMIDSIICDKADRKLPLILAGIDSEVAEYRDLSDYPTLTKHHIAGNQKDTNLQELFGKARAIIYEEVVEPEHTAAIEEYSRLQGANPDRVAADNEAITTAAEQGRVDKLLASLFRNTSDTVRDTLSAVMRITFPDSATSKHLNELALTVWTMSGKVLGLQPEQIPGQKPMVARLRY